MTLPHNFWRSLIVNTLISPKILLCINLIVLLPRPSEIATSTMVPSRQPRHINTNTQHTSLLNTLPPTSDSHHTHEHTRTSPVPRYHDTLVPFLRASHLRELTYSLCTAANLIAISLHRAIAPPQIHHRFTSYFNNTVPSEPATPIITFHHHRDQLSFRPPPKPNFPTISLPSKTTHPLPVLLLSIRNTMPISSGAKTSSLRTRSASKTSVTSNNHLPDPLLESTETPTPPNIEETLADPPLPMDTSNSPPPPSSQDDSSNINDILNAINNPGLLQDNPTPSNETETSPSNSPAKKKSKQSSSPDKNSTKAPNPSSHRKKSKKRSSSPAPTSVLKPSKYSGSSKAKSDTPPPPPHVHKHRNVLIEISIDFTKDSLIQFEGDNGKKTAFAIQQLLLNLKIADKHATLNPTEDDSDDPALGGQSSSPVPTNMTALSNYIKGLNPRSFQTNGKTPQENQDATPSSRRPALAYGVISISCDKDPTLLVNQISYEWARFGTQMRIKELQAVETITPYAIYFVYALTHRQTLIDEQRDIFKLAQQKMNEEDYFLDHDLPINWGYKPLPLCSLRTNVPRIPKHSEPANMSRLPSNIQTCRRVIHLEIDKKDQEIVSHLVKYAKKKGLYSQWWGTHAHPTDGVDWQSPPGDIKRAAKFAVKTTNYNASMTSIDVFGFLDLNDVIHATKPDGTIIKTFTGRECLTSLFKFQDSSPLIAEAHQQVPLGSVSLIYPNTPEGEKLITGLAKQIAAFSMGHLTDLKVEDSFIQNYLKTFVDPQLIHEASQCEWDSKTQTLLTPSEMADNSATMDLEEQGWWRDVVVQYETKKGLGKRSYAAPQALFDLDGTQSVKTMHEANDNASGEHSQESSKRVRISKDNQQPANTRTDNSESSVVPDEGRGSKRSGLTPTSDEVRINQDIESSDQSIEEVSSSASTASAADFDDDLSGTSG